MSNDYVPEVIRVPADQLELIHLREQLFGNWLAETKELQEQFYGKEFKDFDDWELVDWVRINVLAAEDELHEALGEISWKPWARASYFHREAFLGEIVDVLHFVGNLCVGAGISDAELNEAYLEKMERNRERQRSNYTGLDKCPGCKRALDDITAHGGVLLGDTKTHGIWCQDCWDKQ